LKNGEKLAYRTFGDGSETIILIHGYPGDQTSFDFLIPFLKKSDKLRIITVDLRHFGDSSL
jgi:pimeloyl-ACP methyl ester carboxylesterase